MEPRSPFATVDRESEGTILGTDSLRLLFMIVDKRNALRLGPMVLISRAL